MVKQPKAPAQVKHAMVVSSGYDHILRKRKCLRICLYAAVLIKSCNMVVYAYHTPGVRHVPLDAVSLERSVEKYTSDSR